MEIIEKRGLKYLVEKLRGHFVTKDWEKLCDLTTTEAVVDVRWQQGDNGQRFDDYSEIFVQMILQPTVQSERRIQLGIIGAGSWNTGCYLVQESEYLTVPNANTNEHTMYAQCILRKTPAGITQEMNWPFNNTSVPHIITRSSFGGVLSIQSPYTPEVLNKPVFLSEFKNIAIGNYAVKCIEPNCRFVIWGKK